jgi:hypothetical protein
MGVSPRSQIFFRPEEGERRSEAIDCPAPVIASLAEPDHDSVGVVPWPLRRHREGDGSAAVMALRDDVDLLSDHRRHPERIGRTARVPLTTIYEPNSKWRRCGGERIRDVDVAGADPDQIVIVQCGERTVGRADALDRDRSAAFEKHSEDQSDEGLFAGGSTGDLSCELTPRLELLRRQDHELRHGAPSFLTAMRVQYRPAVTMRPR